MSQHKPDRPALKLEMIGKYKLGRTLGEGVSGVVKECTNENGERYAMKIINTSLMNPKQKERLQRETQIMQILDHPAVVRLYEIIDLPDFQSTCLVLEYVDGYDLFDVVIQRGQITEPQAAKYMRQIVEALEYCHANLVMHRDLKLENILVTKEGRVKITDFGISNWMKPGALLDTYCGSPFYWSPEMIQRIQYIGPEVDIWSLGVCLYCMVTGLFPWEGATAKEQLANAVQGKYEAPVFLSDDCKDLLKRMLDPNPKTRCTLPEIKIHAWLNDGLRIPPPKSRKIENLDPDILSKLKGFGLSLEDMKDDILNRHTSQAYVLYTMMLEYREKQGLPKETPVLPTETKETNLSPSTSPQKSKRASKNLFKNIFGRTKQDSPTPSSSSSSTSTPPQPSAHRTRSSSM